MEDIISQTKAEYVRAKERIAHLLDSTPDDKINWSPSPSARTPIHLVAHAAMGVGGIHRLLLGESFPYAGIPEAEVGFRAAEKEFTTRKQALDLLEQVSAEYIALLDGLTPEQLGSTRNTPFGTVPVAAGITFAPGHLRGHATQLEYVQTIYGDYDWHM